MRKGIHPEYRFVAFRDINNDDVFVTRSTIRTEKTIEHEGEEYPLVNLDISSTSHPFYTGTQRNLDTEGRIEKFYKKYGFKRPGEAEAKASEAEDTADETATDDAGETSEA